MDILRVLKDHPMSFTLVGLAVACAVAYLCTGDKLLFEASSTLMTAGIVGYVLSHI